MNRWLVSVRNLAEVNRALAAGADIIDLKEPNRGALGALSPETVRHAVALVGGRCPTSATIGDLPMEPMQIRRAVEEMAVNGVDYVKIGLFSHAQVPACLMALRPLAARGISLVGVIFADQQPDFSWITLMGQAGFKGAMLDTADKNGRNLLNHLSLIELRDFVKTVRGSGLVSGLAGAIGIQEVPQLLPLESDYLGFRSALCHAGQRQSTLDPKAMTLLRRALKKI